VIIDTILVPILGNKDLAGPSQCEAITRIVREGLPLKNINSFLFDLFDSQCNNVVFSGNERPILVIQNILNLKADISQVLLNVYPKSDIANTVLSGNDESINRRNGNRCRR